LGEENIMDEPKMVFDPFAGPQQREVVEQILALLKVRLTGHEDWYPVAFFLKTDAGEILGGLLGMIWARRLDIGSLAVHELFRGRGWGYRLPELVEQYALERGCTNAWLSTHSFQARPL
jgi:GNAT superfamily N-acetyltransferase